MTSLPLYVDVVYESTHPLHDQYLVIISKAGSSTCWGVESRERGAASFETGVWASGRPLRPDGEMGG